MAAEGDGSLDDVLGSERSLGCRTDGGQFLLEAVSGRVDVLPELVELDVPHGAGSVPFPALKKWIEGFSNAASKTISCTSGGMRWRKKVVGPEASLGAGTGAGPWVGIGAGLGLGTGVEIGAAVVAEGGAELLEPDDDDDGAM
jgi:hypothetical protein